MKRLLAGTAVALTLIALAAPAGASTQTVTASLGSSITMGTAPTSTISNWALSATGANTTSGGTASITANVPYTLSVTADKTRMSEYDTSTNAYVTDGKTLGAALNVVAASTSGTGTGATAVVGTSTTLATGLGLGTDTYSITLSQATTIADAALAENRTYRIVLTYTAAATL